MAVAKRGMTGHKERGGLSAASVPSGYVLARAISFDATLLYRSFPHFLYFPVVQSSRLACPLHCRPLQM